MRESKDLNSFLSESLKENKTVILRLKPERIIDTQNPLYIFSKSREEEVEQKQKEKKKKELEDSKNSYKFRKSDLL